MVDPFHLVRLANTTLDMVRRWVQNTLLGHRGHCLDPLYRARQLLPKAAENVDADGRTKLRGLGVSRPPPRRCTGSADGLCGRSHGDPGSGEPVRHRRQGRVRAGVAGRAAGP